MKNILTVSGFCPLLRRRPPSRPRPCPTPRPSRPRVPAPAPGGAKLCHRGNSK